MQLEKKEQDLNQIGSQLQSVNTKDRVNTLPEDQEDGEFFDNQPSPYQFKSV